MFKNSLKLVFPLFFSRKSHAGLKKKIFQDIAKKAYAFL